ncbi:MAG: hypothetical protein H6622_11380 [Halobacteriovoraceae bacterium]|nr:hypothetical protein [Halobacteriovoraceae bacterium]
MDEKQEKLNVITILKQDATNLFERIVYREADYLYIMSMRRTREHFKDIFKNRYDNVGVADLKLMTDELITAFDQFYKKVDEIKWYLFQTEDLPVMISKKLHHDFKDLRNYIEQVSLYANAEIETLKPENVFASLLEDNDEIIEGEEVFVDEESYDDETPDIPSA